MHAEGADGSLALEGSLIEVRIGSIAGTGVIGHEVCLIDLTHGDALITSEVVPLP